MGVRFMAACRRRAKSLGGRELSLEEARAVRVVLEKMGRATADELSGMDTDIHAMEAIRLLEDLEHLRFTNRTAITRLQMNKEARLSHDERVHLLAWTERIELLQRDHPEVLHAGHLLQVDGGSDPVLRELNLAFMHIGALANHAEHQPGGLIDPQSELPTPWLTEVVGNLQRQSPLAEHLREEPVCGGGRLLASLPEDPIERSWTLHLYIEYLEHCVVANAFAQKGALRLPTLSGGVALPGYHQLGTKYDVETQTATMLHEVNYRLAAHGVNGCML